MRAWVWGGLLALVGSGLAWAGEGDVIFGGPMAGFESKYFVPQSDAEAARFLTQATFGPSRASIAQFRATTYDGWIGQQLAMPTTSARAYLDQLAALPAPPALGQSQRIDRWFHTVALGQDQLRQRMAFALSQILVVSDRADALSGDHFGVAEYWDILARNAFGNYRTLLEEVTKSPMMGRYLTHFRNRKSTPALATTPISPDENYAREIMQLFTVGLIERNLDFTPVLAGNEPIATYDQNDITELARVFTGWSYACGANQTPAQCNTYSGLNSGVASYQPMACFPAYMDFNAKTIIGNSQIAAVPGGVVCGTTNGGQTSNTGTPSDPNVQQTCRTYCTQQIDDALDVLFHHPNTAPFVSRQLIQRFVTSNPSAAYIARVAAVFEDNGSGVRGDLGAVIQAVLLDDEAREPPLAPDAPYGKLREPLLRLTAVWRAFGVTPPVAVNGEVLMGIRNPQDNLAQRPLGAPTVFNFYEPDYQPPGALGVEVEFAPEFQIANETTVMTSGNELWNRIWAGYSTSSGNLTVPGDRAHLNIADLVPLVSGAQATGTTAYDAFLDELSLRLMYGTMSPELRASMKNFLRFSIVGAPDNVEILTTLHVLVMTPDFMIQR